MAPGYWGSPTSTLDWCEENYAVTHFIAEFWNTVSNVLMIVPPLVTVFLLVKQQLEHRLIACHISLLSVGIGSWCFHMTLLYSMQLLDELPMIWGSAFLVYSILLVAIVSAFVTIADPDQPAHPCSLIMVCTICYLGLIANSMDPDETAGMRKLIWIHAGRKDTRLMVEEPPNKSNVPLQMVLFLYCAIVTIIYMLCNYPVFFQASYAIMVLSLVISCVRVIRNLKKCNKRLFLIGVASYAFGFFLWNVDNGFCGPLQTLRDLTGPLSPFFELHAWWHLLAGLGTYLGLVFISETRCHILGLKARIRYWLKVWPYLSLETDTHKQVANGVSY